MAKRRRKNPEAEDLKAGVDDLLARSATALDLAYEEHKELDDDIKVLLAIKKGMEEEGKRLPKEGGQRLRTLLARRKELERRFDLYGRLMIKDMKKRVKKIEASPIAGLRSREIKSLKREIFKLDRFMDRGSGGKDIRHPISHAMVALSRSRGTPERSSGRGRRSRPRPRKKRPR